jgi:negative regulator of flagellin synthesis FlgM
MTVDFNGIGPGQVNTRKPTADKAATRQPVQQAPAEQARTQAQNTRGENLNLSRQARELKDLEQKLGEFPEMDDAKVEQIRAALADGSYKVDAEKLAQKMLDMDKSIFG